MSYEVDYLPVATGTGNNADTQTNFAGSTYQQQGFVQGVANPAQANKLWRQSSIMAAALATFISNVLSINVLDDGNLGALVTNLTNAITALVQSSLAFQCSFGSSSSFVALPAFLTGGTTRWIIKWGTLPNGGYPTTYTFDSTVPFGATPVIVGNPTGGGSQILALGNFSATGFSYGCPSGQAGNFIAIGHS